MGKKREGNPRLWPKHVSKITLHNSLSPTLIISNESLRCRGRARPLCAHDWAGHIGTALAECAGVIARYWITVGIPYVIFFLCISFTRRSHGPKNRSITPFSAKTPTEAEPETHKATLRLFNDRFSCFEHHHHHHHHHDHHQCWKPWTPTQSLHSWRRTGWQSLPLAQRCGMEENGGRMMTALPPTPAQWFVRGDITV